LTPDALLLTIGKATDKEESDMPVSAVSSKGQITLPSSLRKRLGIRPHDRVMIEGNDEAIVIKPVADLFQFKGFLGTALSRKTERKRMEEAVAARHKGRRP
jgi:AbrB family looped-hinge helix DNA binding protein